MSYDLDAIFGPDAPAKLPSCLDEARSASEEIAAAHRKRVAAALVDHVERQGAKKVTPWSHHQKPADFLGIGTQTPETKKRKTTDLNARAREAIKERGLTPVRADHYDARLGIQRDFLKAFDYIGLGENVTAAIQLSTVAHASERRKKVLASPGYRWVKSAGWQVWLLLFEKVDGRWRYRWEDL